MTTKQLRNKILDLAIHGKLVPQDPNDEPASALLARIRAEKEQLVKDGKLKKKDLVTTPVSDEDKPFEVPEGWEWCRLGEICEELKYGTSNRSETSGKVAVLRMGNISKRGTINYDDLVYTSNDEDIETYNLCHGDLLFNRTNSSEWVGKTALFDEKVKAIYAGYLIRIRLLQLCPHFVNAVMNSSYYRDWCNSVKTDAVNQSNINAQKLSKLLIPLPPLSEQHRIVSAVEQWMSLVDVIESGQENLQQSIALAKNKILDLAIKGKLVPQDADDEPASVLLERIHKEKEQLVKDGKLKKKDLVTTPVSDEDKPFEVPEGWEWCYLDICTYPVGNKENQIQSKSIEEEGTYRVVSQGSELYDGYTNDASKVIKDLPLVMFGDHTRNVKYVNFPFVIGADGTKFHKCICIEGKYLYYWMLITADHLRDRGYARHYALLKAVPIPLPPLSEQHRIVAKIEELFTQLDTIANALK